MKEWGQQIDVSFFTMNWMDRKLELVWYFLRIIKIILKHIILREMEKKFHSSVYQMKYSADQDQRLVRGLGLY
jgi:hypothetical protein